MSDFVKKRWMRVAAALLAAAIVLFAAACAAPQETSPGEEKPGGPQTPGEVAGDGGGEEEDFGYDTDYEPTLFDGGGASYSVTGLAEGVRLVKNTITLNNGNVSVIYATETDLSLANITAGNAGNRTWDYVWQTAVPYAQLQAWEEDNAGGSVVACVNADFFGSYTVNAFVKDGVILKAGHNDNGSYDYNDSAADVPASAPMLFGVKGDTAQIAPIVSYEGDAADAEVKQRLVQARFTYTGKFSHHYSEHAVSVGGTVGTDSLAFFASGTASAPAGSIVLELAPGDASALTILSKTETASAERFTAGEGRGYLIMHPEYTGNKSALRQAEEGDALQLSVASPDGLWDGYETVVGCRQALVVDGEVAETVALENSNGAQSAGIPRTAVGIKEDGTVVIFSVEGLRYGGKSQSESDTYGLTLPELAEFIRFYGCADAANFDGGGSTQLLVRENGELKVAVRSSDTGSSEPASSRAVMNTLLVTAG